MFPRAGVGKGESASELCQAAVPHLEEADFSSSVSFASCCSSCFLLVFQEVMDHLPQDEELLHRHHRLPHT